MLNAIPYLGKNRKSVANVGDFLQHAGDCDAASAAVEEKPLSQYMTEKLVKRYSGSGRNVIVDKCHFGTPGEKFGSRVAESEVFGWSQIPNNTGSRSRIFCPTPDVQSDHF